MSEFKPLQVQTTGAGHTEARIEIDAHAQWKRPLPLLYMDLSPVARPTTVFDQRREQHAAAWVSLGARFVYGSHHFHGFLDAARAHLCLQETDADRVHFRLDHHMANAPDAGVGIPRIRRAERSLEVCVPSVVTEQALLLPGPVCFGSPTEPGNWGVWLLEGLPNAHEFVRRGQEGTFLCWRDAPWQDALLRFVGVDLSRVVRQEPWRVYRCEDLAVRQVSRANLVPTRSDLALFRDIAARCGPAHGPERIFLGRRHLPQNLSRRRLLNEAELAAALSEMGFVELMPDLLNFQEQVRLFHGARVVVGLGGAALFSTVFSRPGTMVISLEGGPYFTEDHASLFAGLGHNYGFILGQQPSDETDHVHGNWWLDVPRTVRALSVFC